MKKKQVIERTAETKWHSAPQSRSPSTRLGLTFAFQRRHRALHLRLVPPHHRHVRRARRQQGLGAGVADGLGVRCTRHEAAPAGHAEGHRHRHGWLVARALINDVLVGTRKTKTYGLAERTTTVASLLLDTTVEAFGGSSLLLPTTAATDDFKQGMTAESTWPAYFDRFLLLRCPLGLNPRLACGGKAISWQMLACLLLKRIVRRPRLLFFPLGLVVVSSLNLMTACDAAVLLLPWRAWCANIVSGLTSTLGRPHRQTERCRQEEEQHRRGWT